MLICIINIYMFVAYNECLRGRSLRRLPLVSDNLLPVHSLRPVAGFFL